MAFCCGCALVWAAVGLVAYFLFKKFFKCPCSEPKLRKTDWKEDTVYLYQFERPPKMASLSPFCIKLEMFMRLNDIKYVNCFINNERSKYGLVPFIELNGVHYADSEIILDKLKEHFKIKPLEDLREEAFARSLDRLADNHTFGIIIKFKIVDHTEEFIRTILKTAAIPEFLKPLVVFVMAHMWGKKVKSRVDTMLGPFSSDEFYMLLKKDLDTFRDALGNKKFLMGDEPTWVDCTVFGQLAQVCYLEMDTVVKTTVRDQYPTLQEYMDRVIAKVFPAEYA